MSYRRFHLYSSLLILAGIAFARFGHGYFGSNTNTIALCGVLGAWLILLTRYSYVNKDSAFRHAALAILNGTIVIAICGVVFLGTLQWVVVPVVQGFFSGLSEIDGSHGRSNPRVPPPNVWRTR